MQRADSNQAVFHHSVYFQTEVKGSAVEGRAHLKIVRELTATQLLSLLTDTTWAVDAVFTSLHENSQVMREGGMTNGRQ